MCAVTMVMAVALVGATVTGAAGGLVCVGADNGRFSALEAATGDARWTFECGGPVRAAPAVVGAVVFLPADDDRTYALDRKTRRKLWSRRSN